MKFQKGNINYALLIFKKIQYINGYVKAENIVLKNKGNQNAGSPQNHTPQGQPKNRIVE